MNPIINKIRANVSKSILKTAKVADNITPKEQILKKYGVETEIPQAMKEPVFAPDAEAEAIMSFDIADYDTTKTWQMNFDTIQSEDDVKSVIGGMAEKYKAEITESRRGVLGDEQLKGLAKTLGAKPDFIANILQRKHGDMMTPEHIMASRAVLEKSASELKRLAKLVADDTLKPEGISSKEIRLQFSKQHEFHKNFMNEFMGMRAEFGRGLRAFGVPQNNLEYDILAEQMNRIQAGYDIDKAAKDIMNANTAEDVTKMVKSHDGWMRKAGNVFVENYINSILSGFKTHIINTTSGALRLGFDIADTYVAARVGKDLPNPQEKMMLDEWKAGIYGLQNNFMESFKAAGTVMKTAEPYGGISKLDAGENRAISSKNLGLTENSFTGTAVDLFGSFIRFPTERLMGAEDAFFKHLASGQKRAQLAFREANQIAQAKGLDPEQTQSLLQDLMENPTETMLAGMNEGGLTVTFQKPLGEFGQQIQKLAYSNPVTATIMPFIKTPTNLLKEAFLERTPMAMMTEQYKNAVGKGGAEGQMARAKMYVGTAASTMIATMAATDRLTGSSPSDPATNKAKMETGWRPSSIKFGNTYVSYARLEPFSYIFSTIADISELYKFGGYVLSDDDKSELEKVGAALVTALANATTDRTFMSGLNDFMQAMSQPDRYASSYLSNIVASSVPYSLAQRDIARMFDENRKYTSNVIEKIQAKTPYYNTKLPNALDSFGDNIVYDTVLNPFTIKEQENDLGKLENMRIAESIRKVPITMPERNIGGVNLSSEQYHKYVKLSRKELAPNGINFRQAIEQTIKSDEYQNLTDEFKLVQLRNIKESFDTMARQVLLSEDTDLLKKVTLKRNKDNIKQQSLMTGKSEKEIKEDLLMKLEGGM